MHMRRPDQLALNNCEPVTASFRELFALILMSDKRLFNESFGYHCAACFKLPSTVCFVGTKPNVYSYPFHTNIIPRDEKTFIHTIDKYMEDTPWAGEKMYECPYDVENLFNITSIVESIKKQPKNMETVIVKQPMPQENIVSVPEPALEQAMAQNQLPNNDPKNMGRQIPNLDFSKINLNQNSEEIVKNKENKVEEETKPKVEETKETKDVKE